MNRTLPGHEICRHKYYGLSCADYEQMLTATGQRCEICQSPAAHNTTQKLFIDHDESVGRWAVRGLLCHRCNSVIADKPGWGVTLPPGTAAYLANPWYMRRLAESGMTLEGPSEPLEGGVFYDTHNYRWERRKGQWVCSHGRVKWRTWREIMHGLGPYAIRITDHGVLPVGPHDVEAFAKAILDYLSPEDVDRLGWLLAGGGLAEVPT